jgi:hypothetical protein
MARMTDEELAALRVSAEAQNAAISADILETLAKLDSLQAELLVVDVNTATLRDKLLGALNVFYFKFNAEVRPLLPTTEDPAAEV